MFHVHRTGSGVPLIFLHNGGTYSAIWRKQVERFSKSHTCYALDLPGFGPAGETTYRPVTMPDLIAALEDFRQQIAVESFSLIGNCMGSALALHYTLAHPQRIERLALFNILTQRTLSCGFLGPLVRWTAHHPALRLGLRKWLGHFRLPSVFSRSVVRRQFQRPRQEWINEFAALYRQKSQSKALLDILVDMPSYARLDELALPSDFPPVLVIWGEANQVLPAGAGRALCQRLGVTPHILPGGHLLMLEEGETVNRILDDFLGGDNI